MSSHFGTSVQATNTGLIYRNPKPHLRAIHAWHPTVVALGELELLCTFDLGQAVESLDYRTYISHSTDGGSSWSAPRPLVNDPTERPNTHSFRITQLRDHTFVGFGGRFYRDDPEEGLTNRDNLGFVPMDLITTTSVDSGLTWSAPTTITPPLVGPAFEICHAIIELQDGRWLAPTQTWRGWHGDAPNGMKAIASPGIGAQRGRSISTSSTAPTPASSTLSNPSRSLRIYACSPSPGHTKNRPARAGPMRM